MVGHKSRSPFGLAGRLETAGSVGHRPGKWGLNKLGFIINKAFNCLYDNSAGGRSDSLL